MMIGAIIALSITPFAFADESTGFAEPMNDVSMNWMHQKAKEKKSSIVGS